MKSSNSTRKVAFVTGGAKRIGAEMVRALHRQGYRVAIHYRNSTSEAKLLATELNHTRADSVHLLRADLTDIRQIDFMLHELIEIWGRLDVLINNAASFYPTKLGQVTEAQWDDLFACNLKGPFFLSQAAASYLAEVQGVIINIADAHAEHPLRDHAVYCMSKAGLVMMTRALAKELGPHVRVNAVAPGAVMWPEGNNALDERTKRHIKERAWLKRTGDPQSVVQGMLYLVEQADFVTGQVLAIDGGR